ncbi:Na(+)-translocating NADH-quinone reductase subunit A [Primorskyibacter aestuariivivens]|uniref:Na(+)-translocating NADH-quinone reductase subunit A n=1 Tax=Primorskyibacter aestuariivivens TaxID=1888912 RepID=UPI00230049BA|nr:Na(+)-translocating NADH-quinone reductase subunit A [Primorskyibacter aestuariivivens]MDA7430953.1 Na(+)-translocating NADH-quinone reductase subunit A [Primorskyibacter aestuariivivens]
MAFLSTGAGLNPEFQSPLEVSGTTDVITEEAALCPPVGPAVRVTPLVQEDEVVARGSAVACLRHNPEICFTAPIAGRVARITLQPGRLLSEIVLFRDDGAGVETHDPKLAETDAGLRRLMQSAGVWPWLRRRPFGGMPAQGETPSAILVMAADTRPLSPDPVEALGGREEDLARGFGALARLTNGPVVFCTHGDAAPWRSFASGRIQIAERGTRHPQASAGICVHGLCPAGLDTPVWDIHAEDVAALGTLLRTGILPMNRLVRIAGAGLREARRLRTHPGADLRQLTRRIAAPGAHVILSGSPLDGHAAHWLAPRHRQVTVLPRYEAPRRQHWLVSALTETAGAGPAIPTAALTQAFGAVLPAAPFIRALEAGDDETAMNLGLLSLLEEDVALADYVLCHGGQLMAQLRAMLDRIRREYAA